MPTSSSFCRRCWKPQKRRSVQRARVCSAELYLPAAVIRLSKKMGYTGYTDMIYRIGFLIQNEIDNKNHASDITAFIGVSQKKKYTALWSCSTPTGKSPSL